MEQHEELTMNTTPAFADNLAQLRATHNMTQEQLAALEAYDAGWNRFSKAITFGTAMVLLGVAASGFALSFGLGERIAGVLWILAVAVFLVWSFLFDAWKISWLTFVVAGLLTSAVGAAFSREGDD